MTKFAIYSYYPDVFHYCYSSYIVYHMKFNSFTAVDSVAAILPCSEHDIKECSLKWFII